MPPKKSKNKCPSCRNVLNFKGHKIGCPQLEPFSNRASIVDTPSKTTELVDNPLISSLKIYPASKFLKKE